MDLVVTPAGVVRCVYCEALDLRAFGNPIITRASHVEPDGFGGWLADLKPMNGPLLGPFNLRSTALAVEHEWLVQHWLTPSAH